MRATRSLVPDGVTLLLLVHGVHALRLFSPADFAIKRQIGQLGFATETEWQYYGGRRNPLDPDTPSRTVEASGASVRLFDAELYGQRVLLKEYLGDANSIGKNELAVYQHMYGEGVDLSGELPVRVGTMLGHMRADEAFDSADFKREWGVNLPTIPPPQSGNMWTVFAWEGLQTVAAFPNAAQTRAFWDWDGSGALAERKAFLRAIIARTLRAVALLHGRGIVHRSLGGSSILLNTFDVREARNLDVKITDFGFAVIGSRLPEEEVAKAMRLGASSPLQAMSFLALNDLHGLAYVLLELVLCALSESNQAMLAIRGKEAKEGGGRVVELQGLKRLVEDVFHEDVSGAFREYCVEEAEWVEAVGFLDEQDRAGWELLQLLVDCHKPEAATRLSAKSIVESCTWLAESL